MVFVIRLKQVFWVQQNLGEHEKVSGALTPNSPLGYGPVATGKSWVKLE